jgi:DNA-directed RNA polymerase sigma subunit (sigma70/sigma32)
VSARANLSPGEAAALEDLRQRLCDTRPAWTMDRPLLLTCREYDMLAAYHEGVTFSAIGKAHDVSGSRARHVVLNALETVRRLARRRASGQDWRERAEPKP